MDIPSYTVTAIPAGWMTIERSTMVLGSRYRESIEAPLGKVAFGSRTEVQLGPRNVRSWG